MQVVRFRGIWVEELKSLSGLLKHPWTIASFESGRERVRGKRFPSGLMVVGWVWFIFSSSSLPSVASRLTWIAIIWLHVSLICACDIARERER